VYQVFGLAIDSALPLSDLPEFVGDSSAPVHVYLVEQLDMSDFVPITPCLGIHPDGDVVLRVPSVANYRISENEIAIFVTQGAEPADIKLFLLGSGLGILAHRRGFLPMTASCIETDNGAALLMGRSCSGKSLLALGLAQAGMRVLSDDLVWVGPGSDAELIVYPGIPELRVWRDALDTMGVSQNGLTPIRFNLPKFRIPLPSIDATRPLPISGVYHLLAKPSRNGNLIAPMVESAAIKSCYNCVDQKLIAEHMGLLESVRHMSQSLAKQVAGFRYSSQFSIDSFPSELLALRRSLGA
jgi:hypothetical protein